MVKIKGVKKLTFSQPAENLPDDARWRRPNIETAWKYGRVIIDEGGDVTVRDSYGGGLHTILREHVQIVRRGPRGGRKWEALAPWNPKMGGGED